MLEPNYKDLKDRADVLERAIVVMLLTSGMSAFTLTKAGVAYSMLYELDAMESDDHVELRVKKKVGGATNVGTPL